MDSIEFDVMQSLLSLSSVDLDFVLFSQDEKDAVRSVDLLYRRVGGLRVLTLLFINKFLA